MLMRPDQDLSNAYEEFSDAIFRHCFFRVYHREQARDLMQQVFMKTWEYLASGKSIENLRAFLYRTANNLIIDEARKKKEPVSLDVLEEQGIEPKHDRQSELEATIDGSKIATYLKKLPKDDREILVLRFIDDLSPKEIADVLQETANVVSVRIHRAIKKLRELLPSTYVL
ncbi:sigma-70 family RNA polymerase sigma factor [Patescibacteria group bacterium]|nr:sigma-70 family RNA polymerase sigma factor [Patescibacteria group bacterium]